MEYNDTQIRTPEVIAETDSRRETRVENYKLQKPSCNEVMKITQMQIFPAKVTIKGCFGDGQPMPQLKLNSDLDEQQNFMHYKQKQKFSNARARQAGAKIMERYGNRGLKKYTP